MVAAAAAMSGPHLPTGRRYLQQLAAAAPMPVTRLAAAHMLEGWFQCSLAALRGSGRLVVVLMAAPFPAAAI